MKGEKKMGLTAKDKGGGSYPPIKEDTHHAICYGLFDLGTQYIETFNKSIHKILLMWEIPEERLDIEQDGVKKNLPRVISKKYTLSLHRKAELRKDLEAWRGKSFTDEELKGFNLQNLLGVNCMLQVLHKTKDGKTFANIASIIPLIKGMQKKQGEIPQKYFSFEEHHTNIPEGTPDWITDMIKASNEWDVAAIGGQENGGFPEDEAPAHTDDDIPF